MSGEAAPPASLLEKLEELARAKQEIDAREPERPTEAPPPTVIIPKVEAPPPPPRVVPRGCGSVYSPDRPGFMRSWSEEFAAEREELRRELAASPLAPTTSTTGAGAAPATTRGDALRRLGVRGPRKP